MALIDQKQLTNLRDLAAGDNSFLESVIDAFLPQLENIPGELSAALANGESQSIAELAHSLKGSAGNVGAEDVHQLCLSIEQLARDGNLGPVAELAGQLESAAAATHKAFEAEKAQLS